MENAKTNSDEYQRTATGKEIQLCGFKVADNHFAVSVEDVQEVIRPQLVTTVPHCDEHIRGLINLRGQIVTTVSLRKLFGLEDDLTKPYMMIIVKKAEKYIALTVDSIEDVIDVPCNLFERTPETLDEKLIKHIKGVYKLKDSLLIHLDIEKIFSMT